MDADKALEGRKREVDARFHELLQKAKPHLHYGEEVMAAALGYFGDSLIGGERQAGILAATPNRIVCCASNARGSIQLESLAYSELVTPALVTGEDFHNITFRSSHKRWWTLELPFGAAWWQVSDSDAVGTFMSLMREKLNLRD